MKSLGTIGKWGAFGGTIGGFFGFITGGPPAVIPTAKTCMILGTQIGAVAKVEQGIDTAGRKVEQIVTDTSVKIGENIDKVAVNVGNKMGQTVDALGLTVGKAATTAMDKLCDASIQGITSFAKQWTGVAVAVFVAQGFSYVLKETAETYYKNCPNGSFSNIPCALNVVSQIIDYGIIGSIG